MLHYKYRGLVLHELAEATLTLAAQLFSKEAISREHFAEDLARVSAWLEDGCRWVQGVYIIPMVMYHCRLQVCTGCLYNTAGVWSMTGPTAWRRRC